MPRRIIPPGGSDDQRRSQTRHLPPVDPEAPRPDVNRQTGQMSIDHVRHDAILEGQPDPVEERTFSAGFESVVPGGTAASVGVLSITYDATVDGHITFTTGAGSTIVQTDRNFEWSLDEDSIEWSNVTWNEFFSEFYTNIVWATFFTNFYDNIDWNEFWTENNWEEFFTAFYVNIVWADFWDEVDNNTIPIAKLVKGAECTVMHSTATGVEWAAGLSLPTGTAFGQMLVTGVDPWAWEILAAPGDDYPRQMEWQDTTGIVWQQRWHVPNPDGNAYQLARVNVGQTDWELCPAPAAGAMFIGLVDGGWDFFQPGVSAGYWYWDGTDTWSLVDPIPVTDIAPAGAGTFTFKSINGVVQWVEDP